RAGLPESLSARMSTRVTGDPITPTAHTGTPTIRGVDLAMCKSGLHRNVQAHYRPLGASESGLPRPGSPGECYSGRSINPDRSEPGTIGPEFQRSCQASAGRQLRLSRTASPIG